MQDYPSDASKLSLINTVAFAHVEDTATNPKSIVPDKLWSITALGIKAAGFECKDNNKAFKSYLRSNQIFGDNKALDAVVTGCDDVRWLSAGGFELCDSAARVYCPLAC